MSLLGEIISDIDSKSVPALLRRATVLAGRLQSAPLAEWVMHELNGYPDISSLPDYRGPFQSPVLGVFQLPYTASTSTLQIPSVVFPQTERDSLAFKVAFRQSVAELETAVADPTTRSKGLQVPWNADYVAYINALMRQGKVGLYTDSLLLSAYRPVNAIQLSGILDSVRTRLLNFAIALEQIEPRAGEPDVVPPSQAAVTTVVNNYIFDSTVNVAQASSYVTQTAGTAVGGDPAISGREQVGINDNNNR